MRFLASILVAASLVLACAVVASPAGAAVVRAEHVTGGVLDLAWTPGFATPNTMNAAILDPAHPAYANPSGDHTVGFVVNAAPDSGGIVLVATDPAGYADYTWEAWIFTGDGNTRRGLVVRGDPSNQFQTCYQFVIQSGLFQINFRKLVVGAPTTLGTWLANTLNTGVPAVNTWHKMKVVAVGSSFRCYWDGQELTAAPIVDASIPTGWPGVYNFRFDLGGVPVYYDDLELSVEDSTPATPATWGAVKGLYRK